jgi:hypothetical protein
MRKIRLLVVINTIVMLLLTAVVAQQPASHSVTVAIPAVLKLRLNTSVTTQAEVAVAIEVRDGVYTINPAATEIHILANSGWQLSASYTHAALHSTVQLLGRVAGEWRAFQPYPTRLLSGTATRGWQAVTVAYGLGSLPPDGHYQGIVTYTLSRP